MLTAMKLRRVEPGTADQYDMENMRFGRAVSPPHVTDHLTDDSKAKNSSTTRHGTP